MKVSGCVQRNWKTKINSVVAADRTRQNDAAMPRRPPRPWKPGAARPARRCRQPQANLFCSCHDSAQWIQPSPQPPVPRGAVRTRAGPREWPDTRYNEVISLPSLRVQVRDNKMRMHNPAHPGELLRDYMGKRSATLVAARLEVTQAALSRLLKGHDSVSGEMAFKLSRVFGTSPDLRLNMQIHFDLWQASRVKRKRIARVVTA